MSRQANFRKLTADQVRLIRQARAGIRRWKRHPDKTRSVRYLATQFGVTPAAIQLVVNGLTYKEVS